MFVVEGENGRRSEENQRDITFTLAVTSAGGGGTAILTTLLPTIGI